MADKKGRVQAVIQKNLSEIILYELKSPVTQFVSVNEVKMTTDYSFCKIYVSDINPDKTDEVVSFLNNNKGRIRTMLSKKLSIYKTPELSFVSDKTFEQSSEMENIISMAINRKPVTLKDAFPEDDETAKKEETPMKKPSSKKKVVKETVKPAETKKETTKKKTTKK